MGIKDPLIDEIDIGSASKNQVRDAYLATVRSAQAGDKDSQFLLVDHGDAKLVGRLDDFGSPYEQSRGWLEEYVDSAYEMDDQGTLIDLKEDVSVNAPSVFLVLAESYFNDKDLNNNPNIDYSETVDDLIFDALVMEVDRLNLSDDPEEVPFDRLQTLLGALNLERGASGFDEHVVQMVQRTADALIEIQTEVGGADKENLDRGLTSHANTILAAASIRARDEKRSDNLGRQQMSSLIRSMQDTLGQDLDERLEH